MKTRSTGLHLNEFEKSQLIHYIKSGMRPKDIRASLGVTRDTILKYKSDLQNGTAPIQEDADFVALHRKNRTIQEQKNTINDLKNRLVEAEDIRGSILGLMDIPLKPRLSYIAKNGSQGGRTAILHLSDLHYGEFVDSDEMDGVNSYSSGIARTRLSRMFHTVAELLTDHWHGDRPDEIIICLGGDLISGNIHAELAETNNPAVPATVKEAGELIAGGLILLRETVGCPIRVYQVPGNHSRLTMKPQSKRRAAMSLDLLIGDFAEACLKGSKVTDITFYHTNSPDAYFNTYAYNWMLTHGDTMGAGGGTGYIGASMNILRGHRKLMNSSLQTGRSVHYLLTAHFHTTLKTPFGYANGSIIGYNQYVRDLRADPEPAKQNLLIVHPKFGVIDWQEIFLGHESEGTLYSGPIRMVRGLQD